MASSLARSVWCSSRKARDAAQVSVLIQASTTSPYEQPAVGDVDTVLLCCAEKGAALLDRRIIGRVEFEFIEDGLHSVAQRPGMFMQIVTLARQVGMSIHSNTLWRSSGSISSHAGSSPARSCHVVSKSEGCAV